MQAKPLITVIVPSYNSPDLYRTLRSVLSQDYPRIQLIVVDDGSDAFEKEAVEAFLREGNPEMLQVLVNPQNRGTVYTLNRALEQCCGEYIFNLAGDDCFADDRVLSDWVEAFITSGAKVMTAYRMTFDENLEKLICKEPSLGQVQWIRQDSPQELFEKIAEANFIFGCCTARSAQAVKQYGLFDERYRLVEDHSMNLKLLRLGEPIVFFDRVVVNYRGGGTSSPGKYNEVYARDVDSILQNEVLPYTKNPKRMRRVYAAWKRDQRLLQKRAAYFRRYEKSGMMKLLIQVWYYSHHPWRTLCRIPVFIKKRIKGER